MSSSDRVSPQTEAERSQRPSVSIIVATYGRREVLSYAIKSALAQDYKDFELIVVGDAAGEDTSMTVAEFADPRLRYINLPRNFGEQSGPNNIGIQLARGRYIAFLNQDDLWFADHLAFSVEWLEATFSDVVFAFGAIVETVPDVKNDWIATDLTGTTRNGVYDPVTTYAPVSTWLVRREVLEALGGFRPGVECVIETSQDFLFRAWRAGFCLRGVPNLSVLLLQSGGRTNSYVSSSAEEHRFFWDQLQDSPDHLRVAALERMRPTRKYGRLRSIQRNLRWLWYRSIAGLGMHPKEYRMRRNHRWRAGQFIQDSRRKRGLKPMLPAAPAREDLLSFYQSVLREKTGGK